MPGKKENGMKAVQVRYTVRPDYVAQNRANIEKVMAALKAAPIDGVHYAAYLLEDGQTFVHMNLARSQEALDRFTGLEAFKAFQAALRASDPITPPKPEPMNLVAAGFEV